jgi:hypothetical protein
MRLFSENANWTRHIFYRTERNRTTWKFRIAIVAVLMFVGWFSLDTLAVAIADSLICHSSSAPSDAILVENFDQSYLVFETAARLRNAGVAPRVVVPVATYRDSSEVSGVSLGVTKLMVDIAHVGDIDVVPIREVEPISLNAAGDVRRFLEHERINSVVVVSPLFRSRRSALVYQATLGSAGIEVRCEPAQDSNDRETWTDTWHGMQNVAEQWLKLQYYRLYVLPFHARTAD